MILSIYPIAKAISEVDLDSYRIIIYLNKKVGLESLKFQNKLQIRKKFVKKFKDKNNL